MAFKVGDLVQIKSGGASMTVESVTDQTVVCVWYVGENYYRQEYNAAMLKEAPPEGPGPR